MDHEQGLSDDTNDGNIIVASAGDSAQWPQNYIQLVFFVRELDAKLINTQKQLEDLTQQFSIRRADVYLTFVKIHCCRE